MWRNDTDQNGAATLRSPSDTPKGAAACDGRQLGRHIKKALNIRFGGKANIAVGPRNVPLCPEGPFASLTSLNVIIDGRPSAFRVAAALARDGCT